MGKIDSKGISFIRDVFRRDKQGQDLAISTKELAANASISGLGASMDILQSGDLHGMLSLDRGMLQRFYDYESMDEYSDISSALDIYADDSTQEDSSDGKVLWVECNDDSIKEELMDMYYKRIDIDNNIWPISRGLCKMGNDYEEIIVGDGGVVGLSFLPAKTMRRIENKKGDLFGFMQTFSDNLDFTPEQFEKFRISGGSGTNDTKDVAAFEDWRVVHMRLTAKYRESLYGWSVIDPARWVWKRLMLLEDAVLVYKLTRSPSRYAFYIDVGKVPKYEAQKILRESMQQLKKRKFVNPKCLTGETCVKLLDGTDRSMSELARDFKDEKFWVYSYDLASGRVVPGLASNPRLTDKKQKIYRVVLDSGAVVRCNYIHPFLMRDGTYKAASELRHGDSLMPLYVSKGTDGTQGYDTYRDPMTGERRYVHREVAEGAGIGQIDGCHVHHKNGDKRDNRPENLEILTASEHMKRHPENAINGRCAFVKRLTSDSDFRESIARRLSEWRMRSGADVHGAAVKAGQASMKARMEKALPLHAMMLDIIEEHVVRDPLVTSEELADRLNVDELFSAVYCQCPTTAKVKVSAGTLRAFLKKKGYSGFKAYKCEKTGQARWRNRTYGDEPTRAMNNHKVVSVTVDGYEDVYNLDVDKYHNFLLTAGVFTHNTGKLDLRANPMSMDQDFFFATREGRETTRVESLMGPAYQQVDDVQYFLYKLYAALKIPRAYMGYDENMPSRATLSQEDVRFARTILRVQREIRNGMKKVAKVNLAARRIDPAAVDFDIKMTVPSSIFELGQMEARRARADLASMMERHVSMYWLMKHIYKMSDDEIEDIVKQKKAERAAGVDQQGQEDNRGFESVSGGRIIRNRFGRSGMITERELFSGNREDEKRIEGMVRREIENPNSLIGRQLRENANLLREILHTMKAA